MSAKWKTREEPHKLSAFCSPAGTQGNKDGASSSTHYNTVQQAAYSGHGEENHTATQIHNSSDCRNDILSPVKQKRRISSNEGNANTANLEHNCLFENNPYDKKLNAIPRAGQPILDSTIKDMIRSLRGALQHDMINYMQKSKID